MPLTRSYRSSTLVRMESEAINWPATIITGVASGLIVNILGWGVKNIWARRNVRARSKRITELEQESTRITAYVNDPNALYLYSLRVIMAVGTMLALAIGIAEVLALAHDFSLSSFFTSALSFSAFLFGWEGLKTLHRVKDYEGFRERTEEQLDRLKKANR